MGTELSPLNLTPRPGLTTPQHPDSESTYNDL